MGEVLGRALLTMVPADLAGNIGCDRHRFSSDQRTRLAGHACIGQEGTPALRVPQPDENASGGKGASARQRHPSLSWASVKTAPQSRQAWGPPKSAERSSQIQRDAADKPHRIHQGGLNEETVEEFAYKVCGTASSRVGHAWTARHLIARRPVWALISRARIGSFLQFNLVR